MAPWFLLQFLSAPICVALHVMERQRMMMLFHLVGGAFRVGVVGLALALSSGVVSEVWAVSGWVFYAAYTALILAVVEVPKGTYAKAVIRAAPLAVLAAITSIPILLLV
jgi:hypothetical protein